MFLPPYNLFKKIILAGLGRESGPFKLNFVVTKECHSHCENCRIWKSARKNELTLEEIKTFARENPYFSWISFTGGEPTDREDFVEVVRAFAGSPHPPDILHFQTNGLRPERVRRAVSGILKSRPRGLRVTVSIDGPPEVNDRLRGVPGDFKAAVETLNCLREFKGVHSFVGMTVYPTNHVDIFRTYEAIRACVPDFGFQNFHMNLGNISEHFYGNGGAGKMTTPDMIESVRAYRRARKLITSPLDWVEYKFLKLAEQYMLTGQTPQECRALRASVFVNEAGVVYPCAIWDCPMGSLRDTGYKLAPILEQASTAEARRMIAAKKCANCWTPCEAYQSIVVNACSV